ncbi:GIY-YIG nuclease family protein [Leuconostoc mesenteroides]|uniref:GIY-YIG nuclease family protein n=2 Tax=Leuconostoc TaxID=1243 RepID=UPI00236290AE|nr:GIY-YIG nuclease family protein [Leuconostoc mesenteroides]
MKNYFLYKHINKKNGKVYIGITKDPAKRWSFNGIYYRPKGKENPNRPFWNAIKKYGFDNFEHIILESGLTFEEAIEREIKTIAQYKATDSSFGYNVSKGGGGGVIYKVHPRGMLGKHQTEFQIASHRSWSLKKENNPMTNGKVKWGVTHNHPKGMLGKRQSEKHKEAMSKKTGKNHVGATKIKVISTDGTSEMFYGFRELEEKAGIGSALARKLIKSGLPYKSVVGSPNRYKRLIGYKIEKIPS